MFHTIMLATDGSAAAERASEVAASLSRRYEAGLLVLHVMAPPSDVLGEPNYSQELHAKLTAAHALVETTAERLHELGVAAISTEVVEGLPLEVIMTMLETRSPDLLVLGARGLSPWKGLMLGSLSMAITQRAGCPVLVVK